MTSRSSLLKTKPFLLKPVGKDYLWGGSRLNDDFSKDIDISPLAETWECSTHEDGPSTVSGGEFDGMTLKSVLEAHPDFLGTHPKTKDGLPILIKLIDAKSDLSLQVHPDDEYAMAYENGQLGKTEMWYVLDAHKDSQIIYGFNRNVDKKLIRNSIEKGTIENYLQKIPIKKDDVFYIKARTVHAIGAGALIAEIQESSNLTYRLFDYDRRDKDGNLRELHIDKALEVANMESSAKPRQPMRVLKYKRGCASEFLCRCQYFEVERLLLNTERNRSMTEIQTDYNSFQVLLCVKGCGSLIIDKTETINFFKGDCIFIPANSVPLKLHGIASILKINC